MKKEERDWGEERKKDDRGGQLFCVLNYHFSKTEIPIGRLFVNLSTTKKKTQSQRSPIFKVAFCST